MSQSNSEKNIAIIAKKCSDLLSEFKFDAAAIAHDDVIDRLLESVDSQSIEFILDTLVLIGDHPVLVSNRSHGYSLITYSWVESNEKRAQFVADVENDNWHMSILAAIKSYLKNNKLLDKT